MIEKRKTSTRVWIFSLLVFSGLSLAWDYPDPTYGTSDPPNYKKKQSSKSHGSKPKKKVYSSRYNDPYYGSSNPPGYNERKAKEEGFIYVPPGKGETLSPIYGTGVPEKRPIRSSRK